VGDSFVWGGVTVVGQYMSSPRTGMSVRFALAGRPTVALTVLAAVAFTLVALATARHGPALFPDSALYLSSAESLRAGRGYELYDDRPYTIAPPLFPTLLAVAGVLGVAPRFVNALAFAGTVLVAGRLLMAYFPPRP